MVTDLLILAVALVITFVCVIVIGGTRKDAVALAATVAFGWVILLVALGPR